jgi:hypothetical protein
MYLAAVLLAFPYKEATREAPMARSILYKDHMILSYAVLDAAKKGWEPRVEIVLPRKDGLISTCKQDAENAGIESAIKLIDNGMSSELLAHR